MPFFCYIKEPFNIVYLLPMKHLYTAIKSPLSLPVDKFFKSLSLRPYLHPINIFVFFYIPRQYVSVLSNAQALWFCATSLYLTNAVHIAKQPPAPNK